MIVSDLNGHAGSDASGDDGIHENFGYGAKNLEEKRVLHIVVFIHFFKKRDSQLIIIQD